jgi:hypothetical protein
MLAVEDIEEVDVVANLKDEMVEIRRTSQCAGRTDVDGCAQQGLAFCASSPSLSNISPLISVTLNPHLISPPSQRAEGYSSDHRLELFFF